MVNEKEINKEKLKAEGYDLVMKIEQAKMIIAQCQKKIQEINQELNKKEE